MTAGGAALKEDEPAFPYGPPSTEPPEPPRRADDDDAALLPYLAFAALASSLLDSPAAPRGDPVADPFITRALAFLLGPIRFALAPFSASREPVKKNFKSSRSHEDLASLTAQAIFGGNKARTVRLRTSL